MPDPQELSEALDYLRQLSQYNWLTGNGLQWWTVPDVATALSVGETVIKRMCEDGTLIGAISYGAPLGWRIPRDALIIWLAGRRRGTQAG
jgi:hypothetical protein